MFLDYIIDEAKAKDIILSLTVMDFSEIRQNEHKGFEHEKLYVFGKDVNGVTIMAEQGRKDFCTTCRKETEYILQKKNIVKTIRDKAYTFGMTVAICAECGEEMRQALIDAHKQNTLLLKKRKKLFIERVYIPCSFKYLYFSIIFVKGTIQPFYQD